MPHSFATTWNLIYIFSLGSLKRSMVTDELSEVNTHSLAISKQQCLEMAKIQLGMHPDLLIFIEPHQERSRKTIRLKRIQSHHKVSCGYNWHFAPPPSVSVVYFLYCKLDPLQLSTSLVNNIVSLNFLILIVLVNSQRSTVCDTLIWIQTFIQ